MCDGGVSVHILNCQHKGFIEDMKEDIAATVDAVVKKITP